ncbi:MAG: queuosine precursor transporter, partial [Deltaproteobacteria bacterium]
PGILAMAAIVVASNILVQYQLWDGLLTWGAFSYPFAFLVTDLTNRLQGSAAARRVVLMGFAVGVVCSFTAAQLDLTTLRIAMGSGLAFLVAQLVDVGIFNRLRAGAWWRAPLVSTLVSSTLDTVIFFSVAFAGVFTFIEPGVPTDWAQDMVPLLTIGPDVHLWVSLAAADWCIKIALAIVALVPFRIVIARLA